MTFLNNRDVQVVNPGVNTTVFFPGGTGHPDAPKNGDRIRLISDGTEHADIFVDAGAGLLQNHRIGTLETASPRLVKLSRAALTYVYSVAENAWLVVTSHRFATEASLYDVDTGPHPIGASESFIPVSLVDGDNLRFSEEPDGRLRSLFKWDEMIRLEFSARGTMTANTNNEEFQPYLGIRLATVGSGLLYSTDETFAFQTSRSGQWDWSMRVSGAVQPDVDDLLGFVIRHGPGSGTIMFGSVVDGEVAIEGS